MKDVVKDIVIPGVLPERRVYCLRKIKIIFICFLRCDVFQAKHQESRCLSQRLSTSFRHMKDVPIASHANVRRPTVNGPVFTHIHTCIYTQNISMSNSNKHSSNVNIIIVQGVWQSENLGGFSKSRLFFVFHFAFADAAPGGEQRQSRFDVGMAWCPAAVLSARAGGSGESI